MSNPINTGSYRHYLNFKKLNLGMIEISEPIGFDAASFVLMQDEGRYGRDVTYMNEEISLSFIKGYFNRIATGYYDQYGRFIRNLTHGFDQLIECYQKVEFESEVEYILEKNGVQFITGVLDVSNAETDLIKEFKCKIIQNTKKALLKRRKDVEVDVYSDKDCDLKPIPPLQPVNILLLAKPVYQISVWEKSPQVVLDSLLRYGNFAVNITSSGIDDTLTPFDNYPNLTGLTDTINTLKYVRALNDLTGVKLKIDLTGSLEYITNFNVLGDTDESVRLSLNYVIFQEPYSFGSAFPDTLWFKTLGGNSAQSFVLPTLLEFDLPDVQNGFCLAVWWDCHHIHTDPVGDENHRPYVKFNTLKQTISATSTAFNSVIKGVRFCDYAEQNTKSIAGMSLDAALYQYRGKHYNNFVFNGYGIRQFNKPFYSIFKKNAEQLREINGDFQINENRIIFDNFKGFYRNVDMGGLVVLPDEKQKHSVNQRFTFNTIEIKFNEFEQDRDEKNTTDSIHTQAKYLMPSKQVENNKVIEIPFIRDPFAIEAARRQGIIEKPTTSLSTDDKVFMIDVVEIAPNESYTFSTMVLFTWNTSLNQLTISNTGNFNWSLLGIGSQFKILSPVNVGNYNVVSTTLNKIVLSPIGTIPHTNGEKYAKFFFYYGAIQYKNRTDEGFTILQNLLSSGNYSNLRYKISDIADNWADYFKTACIGNETGFIKNTFFKNNGKLRSEFANERIRIEEENLDIAGLEDKILTAKECKSTFTQPFEETLQLFRDVLEVRGFKRVLGNDGKITKQYFKKLGYEPPTEKLEIIGEIKAESEYVTITGTKFANMTINAADGYGDQLIVGKWFKILNGHLTIYDKDRIPVINSTAIAYVRVNGITYNNAVDLTDALNIFI